VGVVASARTVVEGFSRREVEDADGIRVARLLLVPSSSELAPPETLASRADRKPAALRSPPGEAEAKDKPHDGTRRCARMAQ